MILCAGTRGEEEAEANNDKPESAQASSQAAAVPKLLKSSDAVELPAVDAAVPDFGQQMAAKTLKPDRPEKPDKKSAAAAASATSASAATSTSAAAAAAAAPSSGQSSKLSLRDRLQVGHWHQMLYHKCRI